MTLITLPFMLLLDTFVRLKKVTQPNYNDLNVMVVKARPADQRSIRCFSLTAFSLLPYPLNLSPYYP